MIAVVQEEKKAAALTPKQALWFYAFGCTLSGILYLSPWPEGIPSIASVPGIAGFSALGMAYGPWGIAKGFVGFAAIMGLCALVRAYLGLPV